MKIIIFIISVLISFTANAETIAFDLKSLHNNSITQNLRKSLDSYSKNTLEQQKKIPANKIHEELTKEKFIVLQIEKADFGGYSVTTMFAPKKMSNKFYIWYVWIYEIEKDKFEIRSIKEIAIEKSDEQEFLELLKEKNKIYWI